MVRRSLKAERADRDKKTWMGGLVKHGIPGATAKRGPIASRRSGIWYRETDAEKKALVSQGAGKSGERRRGTGKGKFPQAKKVRSQDGALGREPRPWEKAIRKLGVEKV